ncbi:MAG: nicotinamide mononucleotide transporter [Bacteroidales bacterium]|nr:nicotinamide mononucleotide transporter [Bacteroidales bacterium]
MNLESFISWFSGNYIEVLGVITSLVYLYFSVRQIIWLWPFGIISSALFILIFFNGKFYADMGLQVYYVGVSIYGWIYWSRGGISRNEKSSLPVCRISRQLALVLSVTGIVIMLGIVYILKNFTDSDVPWGDGFTTAGSIVATWMLARKMLEHWLVWIFVDSVAAGLYFYKGLYPSFLLYLIFTIIAVIGYFHWKRSLSENST